MKSFLFFSFCVIFVLSVPASTEINETENDPIKIISIAKPDANSQPLIFQSTTTESSLFNVDEDKEDYIHIIDMVSTYVEPTKTPIKPFTDDISIDAQSSEAPTTHQQQNAVESTTPPLVTDVESTEAPTHQQQNAEESTTPSVANPALQSVEFKCFSCISTDDPNCQTKPALQTTCKKTGCFTLFKPETNVTTRGCKSELADDCNSNTKWCALCFENGCNNRYVGSSAVLMRAQPFHILLAVLAAILKCKRIL